MADDPYAGLGRVVGRAPVAAAPPQRDIRMEKLDTDILGTRASAAAAAANAARAGEETRFVAPLAQAELTAKQIAAEAARLKLEEAQGKTTSEHERAVTAAAAAREKTQDVLARIQEARRAISGWSTGLPGQMLQGVGGTQAKDLSGYIGDKGTVSSQVMLGAMNDLKAASKVGSTGLGQQSNAEGAALRNSIASLDQTRSPEAVRQSLATIERHFRRMYALSQDQNPDDPHVMARFGIVNPDSKPGALPPHGDVTGKYDVIDDPELRGVNHSVRTMLKAGVPADEVKTYLNGIQPGMGDRVQNLDWYQNYYQQNPKSNVEPQIDLERQFIPKQGVAATVGNVAESPVGAAVIGGTDAVTGGYLDEMTSNPELTRAVMSSVQQDNPSAYMAGQVGSGIAGSIALGPAFKGIGIGAKAAPLIEGAIYGSGSADSDNIGDRLLGAAEGAGTVYAGGKILGGLVKGAATVVGGAGHIPTRMLDKYGVPLTVGEIVGGKLARLEHNIGRIPFVGGAIRGRQQEGVEGFNQAAFDHALEPIGGSTDGEIAQPGIRSAKQQIQDYYNATLNGKQIVPDQTFVNNTNLIRGRLLGLPNVGPEVDKTITDNIGDYLGNAVGVVPKGPLNGEQWQSALQALKRVGSKYRDTDQGKFAQTHINDLLTEFSDLAARQHPDIAPQLANADQAWRRYSILKDAVRSPANQEVGTGVFLPEKLMAASNANAERFGARGASAEGVHPFFDLADAGIQTLTPARRRTHIGDQMILPIGAGTAAGVGAHLMQGHKGEDGEIEGRDPTVTLGLAGLAALTAGAPYSKLAQKYLQKGLLAPRSPGTRKVADLMRAYLEPNAGAAAVAPLLDAYRGDVPQVQGSTAPADVELPAVDPRVIHMRPMDAPEEPEYITLPDGRRALVQAQ